MILPSKLYLGMHWRYSHEHLGIFLPLTLTAWANSPSTQNPP
jgi:hypothetical protein